MHNIAVSDKSGTALFYASSDNDTSASLKPETPAIKSITVPVVTLDSVVGNRPVLLVKIDVEGFECEVLEGAQETLKNTQFLIIEAHTKEALNRIKERLGNNWYCNRAWGSDYFFVRAKS